MGEVNWEEEKEGSSSGEVVDYIFKPLLGGETRSPDKVEAFQLDPLLKNGLLEDPEHAATVERERAAAKAGGFTISPIVRQHRGVEEQERKEHESHVREEVERRVRKVRDKAFEEGKEEGFQKGIEEIHDRTRVETEEKLTLLTDMIHNVLAEQQDILKKQKDEVLDLVRTLTKWVILRELKDDGEYLSRLLEKLIAEVGTKNNIHIQVSKDNFEKMPEVLEVVQEKIGKMTNVRLEVGHQVADNGIVLDTESGIILGTIEEQLRGIDRIFGVDDSEAPVPSVPVASEEDDSDSEGENGDT